MDIEAASQDEGKHRHGHNRGSLFGIHDGCTKEEPETLRDEHVAEKDRERQEESADFSPQPSHPVSHGEEDGREDQLHRHLPQDSGHEVGREAVHSRGSLLGEDGSLLREHEDRVERREHPPEDGDKEEKTQPVLDVLEVRVPPHQASQESGCHHLEYAEVVESFMLPLLETPLYKDAKLVEPIRRANHRVAAAAAAVPMIQQKMGSVFFCRYHYDFCAGCFYSWCKEGVVRDGKSLLYVRIFSFPYTIDLADACTS